MKRKIGWGFLIFYNLIRMPITWLLNVGRLHFSLFQIISPNVKIAIAKEGQVKIDNKCGIESGSLIRSSGGKIVIGKNVYINRNCNIVSRESIVIGDNSSLGPNVSVYDHDHRFGNNIKEHFKTSAVVIGKNVWIGTGAIILKGVTIGDGSVIGAGTIITKNIPINSVVTLKNELIMREIN